MEEGRRSGDPSGIVVKNRNSSGCLIVRKKSDGVGGAASLGSRKVFEPKKEKKRPRLVLSDSGSSDELLMSSRVRVAPDTLRVCNGSSVFNKDVVEDSRKKIRLDHIRQNEDGLIARNGEEIESKRSRLDVFEFDDYDLIDGDMMRRDRFDDNGVEVGGRRFLGSVPLPRGGGERKFEIGSSTHAIVDKRKNMYFDRPRRVDRGDQSDENRFDMERDGARLPISMLREKAAVHSDEPIRLQGRNGVLKVMVNKKVGGSLKNYDRGEAEGNRKGSMSVEIAKRHVLSRPSFYSGTKLSEKPSSFARKEKNQLNLQKPLSIKKTKDSDLDSEGSNMLLKLELKKVEARNSIKKVISEGENTPTSSEKVPPNRLQEGKVKRGSGTEKQKLRERIRGMLLNAGWTIDYRPRRNRDYLDAVYINPTGTAYWSIIKAYDALQKQLDDEDDEAKPSGDSSPFVPIADEVLSQLTRKTRKKIEKEMKRKQREDGESENAKKNLAKKTTKNKHDMESTDSESHEEKLSSFIKQGSKSARSKMNENSVGSVKCKSQDSTYRLSDSIDRQLSGSNSHQLQGRKSRKFGRYTLLVRSSSKGMNSENDGFVPYSGKRTLLSWLIDSGTVQLSQKVQYMNRRRTRVMLEGWITRDGIHCGCCSKILTVSKFEIHAGSKLRQPFQNIHLDSGVSLLQCQIDAWNRQEEPERSGYHSVKIDGDDPNDDTCGICADGGDLICCDSCPSTFHQSCLGIQMLPSGDWHCPNCTCKFCGVPNRCVDQVDDATVCALLTCSLCEKKFHESCIEKMDVLSIESISSIRSFCGKKCAEIFEHLQKNLGVKHELEAGFSWSLIRRTDTESDLFLRGLPQRVECNSKLAVALTVMDECFLPIVDRRSGINLLHNILYNCGSNFNRLNYSGFYTAILERGDEIICAASIRFHGTCLAEMPFIGTRHIYRRQGMCRRLFCAIESALCSLKVEKMIIPAIAELMHTWTQVFGFNPLEESLKKEMRSLNMLVFPGTDMLQKLLLKPENIDGAMTASRGAKQMELEGKHGIIPEVANKSNTKSSAGHDSRDKIAESATDREHPSDGSHDGLGRENISVLDSPVEGSTQSSREGDMDDAREINVNAACPGVSLNDASVLGSSLDASDELKNSVSSEGTRVSDSCSGEKLGESAAEHDVLGIENRSVLDSSLEVNILYSGEGDIDDANEINVNVGCQGVSLNDTSVTNSNLDAFHELKIPVSSERNAYSDPNSGNKLAESAIGRKCHCPSDSSHDGLGMENKLELYCPDVGNIQSPGESDVDNVHEINGNVASVETTPSSGEIMAENATKENLNNLNDVSVSSSHGTVDSSMQNHSDPDKQITFERGSSSYVVSHVAPDAVHYKETVLPASGDSTRSDLPSVQNDSDPNSQITCERGSVGFTSYSHYNALQRK